MYGLKHSVRHRTNESAMADAGLVVYSVFAHFGYDCIKTSSCDSPMAHSRKSAHLYGRADDYRVRHITAASLDLRRAISKRIAAAIRERLPQTFDVIFEQSSNPDNDHIHIEYDLVREDMVNAALPRKVKHI